MENTRLCAMCDNEIQPYSQDNPIWGMLLYNPETHAMDRPICEDCSKLFDREGELRRG